MTLFYCREVAKLCGTRGSWRFTIFCALPKPKGKDSALNRLGWYDENSDRETHPVKQLQPNAWGLYDMHGNVWEWCYDAFAELTADETVDPCEIGNDAADGVLRGGGWYDFAWYCRSASRNRLVPSRRFRDFGFRLLTGQPPEAEWQRSATASAERVPRDEAAEGAKRASAGRMRKP